MPTNEESDLSITKLETPRILSKYFRHIHQFGKIQIDQSHPPVYEMLRYSMGWIDGNGNPSLSQGKALRPTLCLYTCESLGTPYEKALPAAVALELIHNFSLIHDDIQDKDLIRHHKPTLWARLGTSKALLAGNIMRVIADKTATGLISNNLPPSVIFEVLELLTQSSLEMIEGQFLDIQFESQSEISINDYLKMISLKTGALIRTSIKVGALVGTQDRKVISNFNDFAINLGVALQIRDEYLGIWGKAPQTGKAVGADILRKKNTLPIIHLKSKSSGVNSKQVQKVFSKDKINSHDVSDILEIMGEIHTKDYTSQRTNHYCNLAFEYLKKLDLDNEYEKDFLELLEFFRSREF
ncbi:MAG: polyprenyl synthetase family protein [SAR202 cluster bacterium]|nr:polyprenyl synthetase family protein [SAR202 cluster bacterium]